MNGNLGVFISCVFCVFIVESESIWMIVPEIEPVGEEGVVKMKFSVNNPGSHINNGTKQVDSTVYQTVNKYYCSLDSIIEGSHLIVYGSSGWTFPKQDVSLTLRYPPENRANVMADEEDYIITGFKVILFIDGPDSEGFIKEGGVLQETISLLFKSRQLTALSYEFWLYGITKDTPSVVDKYSHYRLC